MASVFESSFFIIYEYSKTEKNNNKTNDKTTKKCFMIKIILFKHKLFFTKNALSEQEKCPTDLWCMLPGSFCWHAWRGRCRRGRKRRAKGELRPPAVSSSEVSPRNRLPLLLPLHRRYVTLLPDY